MLFSLYSNFTIIVYPPSLYIWWGEKHKRNMYLYCIFKGDGFEQEGKSVEINLISIWSHTRGNGELQSIFVPNWKRYLFELKNIFVSIWFPASQTWGGNGEAWVAEQEILTSASSPHLPSTGWHKFFMKMIFVYRMTHNFSFLFIWIYS